MSKSMKVEHTCDRCGHIETSSYDELPKGWMTLPSSSSYSTKHLCASCTRQLAQDSFKKEKDDASRG